MEEMNQVPSGFDYRTESKPVAPEPVVPPAPAPAPAPRFAIPTGSKELTFGFLILIAGWLMLNSVFFGGGYQLGYAIFGGVSILLAAGYLWFSGCKPSVYSILLLVLDLVIVASFARSNDAFVKFVMLCFLLVSVNLSLCLMAGQNAFSAKGLTSLGDVIRTVILLSTGKLPAAIRGLVVSSRKGGSATKKVGAALIGVAVALPLLCILIPLLIKADAAFEGILNQLPKIGAGEILVTFLLGSAFAFWLYLRGVGLRHSPKPAAKEVKMRKGINTLTVNTVLIAVSVVYVIYLISQLAYFSGGFAGVLPEEFTLAEYARRGFFEMAWICAVNLIVMCLAVGLCAKKKSRSPMVTRLLCLFIGLVTLFLVAAASAKMYMYIDSYGLTRLRVLTEVIMVFMGITTLIVSLWLFMPKLPYMKAILVIGLVIGAAVSWADVDTVVAKYNVEAYQSGKLETVDVEYLSELGYGAVPYVMQLRSDDNPAVSKAAWEAYFSYRDWNREMTSGQIDDFRDWNYAHEVADPYLPPPIVDPYTALE